jgi:hypothetical protein
VRSVSLSAYLNVGRDLRSSKITSRSVRFRKVLPARYIATRYIQKLRLGCIFRSLHPYFLETGSHKRRLRVLWAWPGLYTTTDHRSLQGNIVLRYDVLGWRSPRRSGMPRSDQSPSHEAALTMVFVIVLLAVLLMLREGAASGVIDRISSHSYKEIPAASPM